MKILVIIFLVLEQIISQACESTQSCKTKWTYSILASSLTNYIYISSSDPDLFLVLSKPNLTIRNPTVQVGNIPYSYTIQNATLTCNNYSVCCSNYSYVASNDTVSVKSIGTTILDSSLSLDTKQSSKTQIINNSYFNSKYKIEMVPLDFKNNFSNSYLMSRNTNVTQQMQQRPMLIPQSFYKTTYQCQFVGQIDQSICTKSCSYFMTVKSLNESGLYQLPNNVYYENGELFTTQYPDINITVTIYDPVAVPVINPITSNVVNILSNTILLVNNTYCLTLALLNPTNESVFGVLIINNTQVNLYDNTVFFQQYQAINVSVCSTNNKYLVKLNQQEYDFEYVIEETPKNNTIIENVQTQCKGICHWWIWLLIGLGIVTIILLFFCISRAVFKRRQMINKQLEDKFKSMAGATLSTNTSLPTLNDQLQSSPSMEYINMISTKPTILRHLSISRRVLKSPRIR